MKVVRYTFLLGLVGLLTGCLTPEEMGYLAPTEPAYATPVTPVYSTTPVYNTSPSYYATPVSGYSTMTVYDGYHPGYGGPRHPHHGPSHRDRPAVHEGHGGPGGHGGPARAGGRTSGAKPSVRAGGSRPNVGGQQPVRVNQPAKASITKPLPRKDLSGKGSQWKGGNSGKSSGSHGKGTVRRRK